VKFRGGTSSERRWNGHEQNQGRRESSPIHGGQRTERERGKVKGGRGRDYLSKGDHCGEETRWSVATTFNWRELRNSTRRGQGKTKKKTQ